MPCITYESESEVRAQQDKRVAKIIAPWKRKLNLSTRLLCEVMTALDDAASLDDFESKLNANADLQKWWTEHQANDAKRKSL